MDNLTHSLVGVMLSRAGLGRSSPKPLLLLILAANIPDCDAISGFWGAAAYFHHHRWYTHALLMLPLMALLPVAIVRLVSRGPFPWARAYLVSLIAVCTHPLLDFTNAYGIRLFLPFSNAWPSLDCTNVVDLCIWAVLLLALLAPMLGRLVSSEIGARTTTGRGWPIFALSFIVLWNAGRLVLRDRAIAVQEGRLYQGAAPKRVSVMPTALNPLFWRGYVETEEFFVVQDVALWKDLDPTVGRLYHKGQYSPAMDKVRSLQVFQDLMGFSRALLWRAAPDPEKEGATLVQATELRFGFNANAVVDAAGRVERSWFSFRSGPQPR